MSESITRILADEFNLFTSQQDQTNYLQQDMYAIFEERLQPQAFEGSGRHVENERLIFEEEHAGRSIFG